jgi:predicted nucleotidyltransferase
MEERIRQAYAFLKELVKAFRTLDPEVEKIVLFGSLAKGKPKSLDFDIDVAVRSSRYLKLVSWTLDQPWKIDLVDLDEVSESLLAGLEDTGVVLYEKNRS